MAEHCDNGHIPYRDWCPDCNEAFGRERVPRGTDSLHQRLVPLVSCGYLLVAQNGVFSRSELPEEECEGALTVLVFYCSATRSTFAHTVLKKGLDSQGYIVEMIWASLPARRDLCPTTLRPMGRPRMPYEY